MDGHQKIISLYVLKYEKNNIENKNTAAYYQFFSRE